VPQVHIEQGSDDLVFSPAPDRFHQQLSHELASWVAQVRSPGRLLLHERLQVRMVCSVFVAGLYDIYCISG
jgi:hypothetical protein